MYLFDLERLAEFKENAPGVRVIAQSGHARYILFTFRAGQGLREHSTSSQIAVQLLSGQLTFTARDESHELQPGHLLLLEANVPHTLHAQTDAILLLMLTPDPQHHSLAADLFDKIQPLATLS